MWRSVGPASGQPGWVGRCAVDTEQGIMGQTRVEEVSKGTISRAVVSGSHASFLKLGVGGGSIAAVGDRAASHTSSHSTEYTRTAQFLAGREDIRRGRWRKTEMIADAGGDRWSTLWNTRTYRKGEARTLFFNKRNLLTFQMYQIKWVVLERPE